MLTVEELKALSVGDWVWVKNIRHDWEGYYKRIEPAFQYDNDKLIRFESVDGMQNLYFEDYGTKWIAYKNKEEADGKSITLSYLLCTSNQYACVIWRDADGKVKKTYTMPIDEAKGVLKEKERLCSTNE